MQKNIHLFLRKCVFSQGTFKVDAMYCWVRLAKIVLCIHLISHQNNKYFYYFYYIVDLSGYVF